MATRRNRCVESLSAPEYSMRLAQVLAGLDERIRRSGVKFEHLEVVWDGDSGMDVASKLGGFRSPKIAGDAPLGRAAIDGKESDIDRKWTKFLSHAVITQSVAAVVEAPGTKLQHVSEGFHVATDISFDGVVRGRNPRDAHARQFNRRAIVYAERHRGIDFQAIGDEGSIGLRDDELH